MKIKESENEVVEDQKSLSDVQMFARVREGGWGGRIYGPMWCALIRAALEGLLSVSSAGSSIG